MGTETTAPEADEPPLASIDLDTLTQRALADLERSRGWPADHDAEGIAIASGHLPGIPTRAYRSEVELAVPAPALVRHLADDTFGQLARWSAEFMHGEHLDTLHEDDDEAAWVVRASYRTPPPLSHREYLYLFARRRLDDARTLILYRSVASEVPVQRGFVRGVLYPTAHLVQRLDDARSHLEHVLAQSLRGFFPAWLQSGPLRRPMVEAHLRDSRSQRSIWEAT